jgi:hypothetical protein
LKEKKANNPQNQSGGLNSDMDIMVTPSFKELNVKKMFYLIKRKTKM